MKNAEKNMMGMQNGDVVATCANVDALANAIGFKPSTSLKQGIEKFVDLVLAVKNLIVIDSKCSLRRQEMMNWKNIIYDN